MKVCLITPPSPFLLDQRVFVSLGILKVGASLRAAGIEVDHLDLTGVSNYLDVVRDYKDDAIFAITATTPQMPAAVKIARELNGFTILGGPHVTLVNAAAKRGNVRAIEAFANLNYEFDSLVCGDGEQAIFEALKGQCIVDADDPKSELWQSSEKFTQSPWPDRSLVDMDSYHYTIDGEKACHLLSQMGCPMGCRFCAGRNSPSLRRMRLRPPDNVIAEILHLHRRYGYRGFNFFDDEVNINKLLPDLLRGLWKSGYELGVEWRLRGFIKAELFTEEQAELMYDAGFRWILIGFESGSDRILRNIHKNATREDNTRAMQIAHGYGIKVKALMSVGHPGESEETIKDTYTWLLDARPDDLDVTVITPYPGSPYWDEAIEIDKEIYCYSTPKSNDVLFMEEVDFSQTADYYKGMAGEYVSHVWTEYLTKTDLCLLRDWCELEARRQLGIAMPPSAVAVMYDHSTGMTPSILRKSHTEV